MKSRVTISCVALLVCVSCEFPFWNDPTEYIGFVLAKIEDMGPDYSRDNPPYSAHVRMYPQFINLSDRTITGVCFKATFIDSFGEEKYTTGELTYYVTLEPGETNEMDTSWYWEDNPFMDSEPYDFIRPVLSNYMDIKITYIKIVFDDGEIINF